MEKYTLLISKRYKRWDSEEEEFQGDSTSTNLILDSVEDAKRIAEIAKLVSYRILTSRKDLDWDYHNPVYETPDVKAYFDKEKKKADEFKRIQEKRVEIINSWPESTEIPFSEIVGFKIFLKRSEYGFVPSYSRNIQGYFKFRFELNNQKVGASYFDPTDYITCAGYVQLKKFKNEFRWEFGVNTSEGFDFKKFLFYLRDAKKEMNNKVQATTKKAEKEIENERI